MILPETNRYQSWEINSYEETAAFLDHIKSIEHEVKYLVLIDESTDKLLGGCQLTLNTEHHTGEIGYMLHPDYYGRGLATYMGEYLLDYGFNELKLNRISAMTDTHNIASYKVMEKVGMQREGLLRQDKIIRGEYRDSYIYGILNEDYNNK